MKPFRIYNTLERKLVDFEPLQPGKIGIYVCGMTVYDDCHVGHARAMVVFDTFVRYLRHRGWEVTFVRNFTDVDDKIIERSAQRGMEPMELANHYIERFYGTMPASTSGEYANVTDGFAQVPTGAGLGLDPAQDVIAEFTRKE